MNVRAITGWAGKPARAQRAASTQSVGRAVLQFALTGLAALAILGFVAVRILQHIGQTEAIRDAKNETRLAGDGIVTPALRPGLLSGQPAAIAHLDSVVRRYVLRGPVVRVKLWDGKGHILYSDEHALIGTRYVLGEDELDTLRTGGVDAEVSDLTRPENRYERPLKKLLEVYLGIRGPRGQRLLYEEYLRYSSVAASGNRLWLAFGPALLITLAALELMQIPLAWSLAQRLRRRQQERELLLRKAIEASDVERRRIARELHDGAVQNLAGVSYTLAATAAKLHNAAATTTAATTVSDADLATIVGRAADETRESVRELRALLVDIYPPTLQRAGLAGALDDLLAPLTARDVKTDVHLADDLGLAPEQEAVLYRVAQESLRNVIRHAHAGRVSVRTAREHGIAFLVVEDDGSGFTPQEPRAGDHFGLRMLDDLARDAGGRLRVSSRPGGGTSVRVEVPVA